MHGPAGRGQVLAWPVEGRRRAVRDAARDRPRGRPRVGQSRRPAATARARSSPTTSSAPGDDEDRAADGPEMVVERRHGALTGTPQRGRQPERVVAPVARSEARPSSRPGRSDWLAKSGCASQASTKAARPSRSSRAARVSSAARRRARSSGSAMPAEGLSRMSPRTIDGWRSASTRASRAPIE